MKNRDRIDPASRGPLEELLKVLPGVHAIPDINARRAAFEQMIAAAREAGPSNERVTSEERAIPGPDGAPELVARIIRPVAATGDLPGILHIHGGGMVLGSIQASSATAELLAERVGAVVVSTDYRKSPEHPHPAAVNDCYAGFTWMAANAEELGFDLDRLAIYGGSAGGNLAFGTALMTRDKGGPKPVFLCTPYPMVDETNTTNSSQEITDFAVWDRAANIEAWGHFLGGQEPDAYASPLRADLRGLPPVFIDVGDLDLFRDEDILLTQRLLEAGVETEFHLYPGAFHGSETFDTQADLSQRIVNTRVNALRRALGVTG